MEDSQALKAEGIREVVPDRVFALGSAFPLDGRVSWVPARLAGYQATNAYLLKEGGSWLLIDPGPAYQADTIVHQLAALIQPGVRLSVFVSRSEPDCYGSLAAVSSSFEIERVLTAGNHNPFDAFDYLGYAMRANRDESIKVTRLAGQNWIELGGTRNLVVVNPPLRVNFTAWLFDEQSGSLFTSDTFSHFVGSTLVQARDIVDHIDARLSVDDVRDHLSAKMWWVPHSRSTKIVEGMRALSERWEIKNICPGHGSAISGREAVDQTYAMMLSVLEQVNVPEASVPSTFRAV